MAIDDLDNIYVTDAIRKNIRKYNADGNYFGSLVTTGSPVSIAINELNTIFIGDGVTGKIFRLNASGTAEQLYAGTVFPSSMVFGSDGLLYVSDSKLQRVIVLDLSGNVVRTIGEGSLTFPTGITFDKKNNRLLVAEHGGIGTGFNPVVKVRIYDLTGNLITSFGSHGNGDGKFYRIQGLAVGRCGEIYVPEPYQGNVSVFNENTVFATRFGQYGDSTGQLRVPLDIAINSQDKIFITAENNGTIEVFNIGYLLPTSKITCGNKTICAGTTTDIPVYFTGNAPWTFTYTLNGINPTTVSNILISPYILTVSAPGNYQVTAMSDSSQSGTCFSGNANITVNSIIPTSSITGGNLSFCHGQMAGIPITLTGMPPWEFTFTRNGINPHIVSNVVASPYILNVSEAGNYAITSLSSPGCSGSSFTGTASVTERALPTATITSANTNICTGDTMYLEIVLTGSPPWSFTYTLNDSTDATVNNIVASPFMLPVSIAGIYKVTQVQDAYCVSTISSGSPVITVNALPTSSISSGNAAFCPGDTSYIIIDFTGIAPWTFSFTRDGLNPVTIAGVTDNPYVLPVSLAGLYQLTALSDMHCNGTIFAGMALISQNPLPAVSLGPPGVICEGDSVILTPGPIFKRYLWSDSTRLPTLTVHAPGTYSVTATDYNGCRNSASKTLTPVMKPTSVITSGNTNICSGETTDIMVELTGIPPWTLTYTVNGSDPQTVANITSSPYHLNVYNPGIYHIIETTDAQCKNDYSPQNAVITVNPLPVYNFSSGNAYLCTGQPTNLVIDLTGTPPWSLTYTVNGSNPVTLTGITSNPLILPVSQGGTYEIVAVSDSFCNGPAHNGTVTIIENPMPVVNLGNDVTIVTGEPYTIDAGPGLADYIWSDGSTCQTLQVNAAGNYDVTVTDYNGCSNFDEINVTGTGIPANRNLQGITVTGIQCFSAIQTITVAGGGTTFMVQNGGTATLIAGHNIIYLPGTMVESGGFMHGYVTPDNTFCSGVIPQAPSSVNGEDNIVTTAGKFVTEPIVKLYPNPSTGLITIEFNNPGKSDVQIEMVDMAGRHVYSKRFENMPLTQQIDFGIFPGGIYVVKINSGTITKIIKLVLMD